MKDYINSDGNPIAYDGREIKEGDTIKAHLSGMSLEFIVYDENGILTAKHARVIAYVITICRGADKVEITNR